MISSLTPHDTGKQALCLRPWKSTLSDSTCRHEQQPHTTLQKASSALWPAAEFYSLLNVCAHAFNGTCSTSTGIAEQAPHIIRALLDAKGPRWLAAAAQDGQSVCLDAARCPAQLLQEAATSSQEWRGAHRDNVALVPVGVGFQAGQQDAQGHLMAVGSVKRVGAVL